MSRLSKQFKQTGILALTSLLVSPAATQAQSEARGLITDGLNQTAKTSGIVKDPSTAPTLLANIGTIINYLLAAIGALFFTMILYGGILWMTDAGEQKNVKKAKDIITNSIIGIVVVFMAYLIVSTATLVAGMIGGYKP